MFRSCLYKISKVIDVKQIADSVKVRHILIPFIGSTRADATVTKTEIEIVDFVKQSVQLYNSLPGSKQYPLKDNTHYPWYEPTQKEIDELSVLPGVFGPNSASLLMKALYCARMVRLDICYTINTLSKYITKWNALCDKQIKHLFSYSSP